MIDESSTDSAQTKLTFSIEAYPIYGEIPQPKWPDWKDIRETKLWVAVALSQNIDPRHFDSFKTGKLDTLTPQPLPFANVLASAINDISSNGVLKPLFIDWNNLANSEIRLSNFVKWAKDKKDMLALPPDFPGITRVMLKPNIEIRLGDGERSLLLALIAILSVEAHIDISKTSKAGSLIQAITENLGVRISVGTIATHLKRISKVEVSPFSEKERITLLIVIAALCKQLSLDISNPSRAAGFIEGLTMRYGAHIEASTIEDYLKRIPKVLDKRSR